MTLLDLIFMLFYLNYDEELSIDAKSVYTQAVKRLDANSVSQHKLLSDQISIDDIQLEAKNGDDPNVKIEVISGDEENEANVNSGQDEEVVLTENQEKNPALMGTMMPDGDMSMRAEDLMNSAKNSGADPEMLVVNDFGGDAQKRGTNSPVTLPAIN